MHFFMLKIESFPPETNAKTFIYDFVSTLGTDMLSKYIYFIIKLVQFEFSTF